MGQKKRLKDEETSEMGNLCQAIILILLSLKLIASYSGALPNSRVHHLIIIHHPLSS